VSGWRREPVLGSTARRRRGPLGAQVARLTQPVQNARFGVDQNSILDRQTGTIPAPSTAPARLSAMPLPSAHTRLAEDELIGILRGQSAALPDDRG